MDVKAFLFGANGANGEKISVSKLRRGKDSVAYDLDFLLFGND
jgi:hypothetical protein